MFVRIRIRKGWDSNTSPSLYAILSVMTEEVSDIKDFNDMAMDGQNTIIEEFKPHTVYDNNRGTTTEEKWEM